MENVVNVARAICFEYGRITGEKIDEMKIHKLVYFAQREALAIIDEPLFAESLHGWKFGPVSHEVRRAWNSNTLDRPFSISADSLHIVKNVIYQYGSLASWRLSELSHRELSWKNARVGLADGENGDRVMSIDDIRYDAAKVRPYDHIWDMYYDEFEDWEEN